MFRSIVQLTVCRYFCMPVLILVLIILASTVAVYGQTTKSPSSGVPSTSQTPNVKEQSEVAKSVIEQMGKQIDLATTLAVAVFGGLVGLIVQVAIHNGDSSKTRISFDRVSIWFICLSLVFVGLSLV